MRGSTLKAKRHRRYWVCQKIGACIGSKNQDGCTTRCGNVWQGSPVSPACRNGAKLSQLTLRVSTAASRAIVSHLPERFNPAFTPAYGLGNPHLQTLWGPLWRKTTHLDRERERLWLEDGDFLDLDWHGPHSANVPLVLVLHGLTGTASVAATTTSCASRRSAR